MKKNTTFGDIAAYTGFSKTTISRYFSHPDYLTPENRKVIADALVALDYKENKVARILASGKTEFIGVIIPNLYLHYYSEILNSLLSSYEKHGYKFIVFTGDKLPEIERKYISELLAYQIEGLIVLSHTIHSEELASYNIPVVAIEREDAHICSVNTDNYSGGVQAAELLINSGCEILVHINSPTDPQTPAYGRITGFKDSCEAKAVPYEMFISDWGNHYDEVCRNTRCIIDLLDEKYGSSHKGVFVSNDTHANIFLNLLLRKYGKLPEDYSLVGFDNSVVSAEAAYPISTIGQQNDVIAEQAMELLLMQMKAQNSGGAAEKTTPVHRIIPPLAIIRETTK